MTPITFSGLITLASIIIIIMIIFVIYVVRKYVKLSNNYDNIWFEAFKMGTKYEESLCTMRSTINDLCKNNQQLIDDKKLIKAKYDGLITEKLELDKMLDKSINTKRTIEIAYQSALDRYNKVSNLYEEVNARFNSLVATEESINKSYSLLDDQYSVLHKEFTDSQQEISRLNTLIHKLNDDIDLLLQERQKTKYKSTEKDKLIKYYEKLFTKTIKKIIEDEN